MEEVSEKVILAWIVGFLCGGLLMMVGLMYFDLWPDHFVQAMKPALESVGINPEGGHSANELKLILNPCIVKGPLPAGCEKYVHDGVVIQPPIKIIVDTSK